MCLHWAGGQAASKARRVLESRLPREDGLPPPTERQSTPRLRLEPLLEPLEPQPVPQIQLQPEPEPEMETKPEPKPEPETKLETESKPGLGSAVAMQQPRVTPACANAEMALSPTRNSTVDTTAAGWQPGKRVYVNAATGQVISVKMWEMMQKGWELPPWIDLPRDPDTAKPATPLQPVVAREDEAEPASVADRGRPTLVLRWGLTSGEDGADGDPLDFEFQYQRVLICQ